MNCSYTSDFIQSEISENMRHPRATIWEEKLKKVFDRIDRYLENKYEGLYPLHPARPMSGMTSNPEQDGLFNIGAVFSAGYGSDFGSGYVVETRISTLSHVPDKVRRRIEKEVVTMLKKELVHEFPGRKLDVVRDGRVYKIYGDLTLGMV